MGLIANFVSMKVATIFFNGQELSFKYEIWIKIDFIYTHVWDKHGKKHHFHKNNRDKFIRPISVKSWPPGLFEVVESFLKAENPEPVVDKTGYYWEH